ncbi:MFS transporter [Oceanimonas sp. MB9]|uniref:MFS transporter n=1 Tax=Oceanimonas sp. MB9 TaxID=2588453 RepID=UPI0013F68780|nr:MFS transporter [Oceanimonas sp. MB9]NHI00275.1 putative MFS-type transporter YcaD [Oceanimonas sp. MB9]
MQMRLIFISLLALFASLVLLLVGNAFLVTLLGLRFSALGASSSSIGLVMVCYSAGFVIGSCYAEKVIKRVGHIRAFSVFASLAAMSALLYSVSDSLLLWGGLRVVGGLSIASLYIVIESWFSAVASNANRAKIFSLYQVAVYCSSAAGQLLLGLGEPADNLLLSVSAILIMAAIIPLSLSRMHSPELVEVQSRMSLWALFHTAPLGMVASFIVGIFLGTFFGLVPLFASLSGLGNDEIALYMFGAILAAMLTAWPVGWICDRLQRSYVLLIVTLLTVVACLANAFLANESFLLRLAAICVCMGLGSTIYPIAVAITHDIVDRSQVITASSGLMLSYAFGSVLGPFFVSLLMESYGPEALFHTLSLTLVFMAVYTLYRQYRQPPIPLEGQEHFVSTSPDVHVISDIDPRNDDFCETPIENIFRDHEPQEPHQEPKAGECLSKGNEG